MGTQSTSLRIKTLLVIGLSLAGLIGVIWLAGQVILGAGFSRVEDDHVRQDVKRAQNALAVDAADLWGFTGDYSDWDQTQAFIRHYDPAYVTSNLDDTTFQNAKLNFFLFVDPQGKIVAGKGFDLAAMQPMPVPPDLISQLKTTGTLLDPGTDNNGRQGVLVLAE